MSLGGYVSKTWTLPRGQAREVAAKYFESYPTQGYDTHVSNWKETEDNKIWFEIKRLRNCD
jgi:hypothetical protein